MSEEREREKGWGEAREREKGKTKRSGGAGRGEKAKESDIEGRTVKITASQEIDLSRINVNLMSRRGSIMYNVCIGLPYMTCFQTTH